jgi:hypothetical protein
MSKFDFGLIEPANGAFVITPSDVNALERPTRGIYVGGAGDVTLEMVNGQIVTFVEMVAGIIHPISAIQVYATGTAATDILGVF